MIENFAADQDETENERPRSLVGKTTDSDFDKEFGSDKCWTCGYRGTPAEIEACENSEGCNR